MQVLKQAALFVRTNLWIIPLGLLLGWALIRYLDPAPPRVLVMSTGSETGGYHRFGLALQERLAEQGLTLELRSSRGSLDNLQHLLDPDSPVSIALVQSGTSLLLTPTEQRRLVGLAALYHEPLWLFQRKGLEITHLDDLRSLKVSVGSEGSGTWAVVRSLFQARDDESRLLELNGGAWQALAGRASLDALREGTLDAAFFVLPASNALIAEMVANPELELVSLRQTEAFSARLPFLDTLQLPEGLLDIGANVPAEPVSLLSPVATLVANERFHPALTSLVLEAAREVLREGNLLDKPGAFPAAQPLELTLSPEADFYHRQGVPFLQRYLPFWVASIVDRYVVLVIPFIAIMLPLLRSMGPLYRWRIRSRVYRWYEQLRRIDRLLHSGAIAGELEREIQALHQLEDELSRVDVPLSYAHELYSLHLHVRYMIKRLEGLRTQAG